MHAYMTSFHQKNVNEALHSLKTGWEQKMREMVSAWKEYKGWEDILVAVNFNIHYIIKIKSVYII